VPRRLRVALSLLLVMFASAACTGAHSAASRTLRSPAARAADPAPSAAAKPTRAAASPAASIGSSTGAAAALAALAVKGRAPMTGYRRDQFGPAWADVNRNGCDTRNDVLARDLTQVTFQAGTHHCVVESGML